MLREHPNATVDVLERTGAVIELGRDFFDTELSIGGDGRADVRVGHLEDLIADARGPYDVVMIDSGALAPFGGVNGLSRVARSRLVELLDSTGVLVWGPMELEAGQPERVDGWPHAVFTRRREDELEDFLLLTGREGSARLPEALDSFDRRPALSATP